MAKKICQELNISLNEVAFIGDDINDIELLSKVGFSAVPNNAPVYIKNKVDLVLNTNGGDGAFREFVEYLVNKHSSIDNMLLKYFEEKNLSQ